MSIFADESLEQEQRAAYLYSRMEEEMPWMSEGERSLAIQMLSAMMEGQDLEDVRTKLIDRDEGAAFCNAGTQLLKRFETHGGIDNLHQAIVLLRTALEHHPSGHPHRQTTMNNLANSLQTLFEQEGHMDALTEALQLHRGVLLLRPVGHPDHNISLVNLAGALRAVFEQKGDMNALTEAVQLHREALLLMPAGHPNRSILLNNLANTLHTMFKQKGAWIH
jgi:hypothetical protein